MPVLQSAVAQAGITTFSWPLASLMYCRVKDAILLKNIYVD